MLQYVSGPSIRLSSQALDMQGLDVHLYHKAESMFHSLRRFAGLMQRLHSLLRRDGTLLDISAINKSCRIAGQYDLGSQSVPLEKIVGSTSRSQDYDRQFRPLRQHLRQRWVKIAALRLMNVSLPAVELIQIGDAYFVIDGHHRISVARALGQDYIDAQVIVWHLEVKPSPEMIINHQAAPQYCTPEFSLARGG